MSAQEFGVDTGETFRIALDCCEMKPSFSDLCAPPGHLVETVRYVVPDAFRNPESDPPPVTLVAIYWSLYHLEQPSPWQR